MIYSKNGNEEKAAFENLLRQSRQKLLATDDKDPKRFLGINPVEFEEEVFYALSEVAKGTEFEGSIRWVAGFKFPDIVARKFYGVEVKTTRQNHWKTVGNSVLESTRIEKVERIYLCFAKLVRPFELKYRLYQDCLSDIAVTHSPRYLIDMSLERGASIFDKIGIAYDELRTRQNPIKPFVEYYRSQAKNGEEPWWMDNESERETLPGPMVKAWSNMAKNEQNRLRNEAMVRFPEIFGNENTKYQNLAAWLAASHGVVDSSLRDRFSAGGKVEIKIGNKRYQNLPRIFHHLKVNLHSIAEAVEKLPSDEAKHFWKLAVEPADHQKIEVWSNGIASHAGKNSGKISEFLKNLFNSIRIRI